MELSSKIYDIIRKADEQFPDDIPAAVSWANGKLREEPEFQEWVESFVTHSIQEMVYDVRHKKSQQIKSQAGGYIAPTKVSSSSASTNAVLAEVYQYRIAGRTLGMLLGSELGDIATNETDIANGHLFNARLCEHLKRLVPENKTVKQAVPEKKLRDLFRQCGKQQER